MDLRVSEVEKAVEMVVELVTRWGVTVCTSSEADAWLREENGKGGNWRLLGNF